MLFWHFCFFYGIIFTMWPWRPFLNFNVRNSLILEVRNAFRVSTKDETSDAQSHTLMANDELDKRHWLQCIENLLAKDAVADSDNKSDHLTDVVLGESVEMLNDGGGREGSFDSTENVYPDRCTPFQREHGAEDLWGVLAVISSRVIGSLVTLKVWSIFYRPAFCGSFLLVSFYVDRLIIRFQCTFCYGASSVRSCISLKVEKKLTSFMHSLFRCCVAQFPHNEVRLRMWRIHKFSVSGFVVVNKICSWNESRS